MDGWYVDKILGNFENGSLHYEKGSSAITVTAYAKAFSAVVKLISTDGMQTKFICIEKPVSVSAGTSFSETKEVKWTVPAHISALMEADDWTIVKVLDAPDGVLTWTTSTISVTSDTTPFDAIVVLTNGKGKTKYIEIERK